MEPTTSLTLTTGPTLEPVTTSEAKKHLELPESETTHDDHVDRAVKAAREQVESDTGLCLLNQTWSLKLDDFPCWDAAIHLPRRPVVSVTSITYYDLDNASQTLASSVYDLDIGNERVVLKYDQEWPSTVDRFDAVTVLFVAGHGAAASTVPELAKQAILLQVGKWFVDREMLQNNLIYTDKAYERIVSRLMRSSYP